MRILMLSPVLGDAYGQERVMRDSTQLLRDNGHEVFFIGDLVRGEIPPNDGYELLDGLSRINPLSATSTVDRYLSALLQISETFNPDVVHFVDQFDSRVMGVLIQNYRTVFTAHLPAATCPSSTRFSPKVGICTKQSGWGCLLHHYEQKCLSHFKTVFHRTLAVKDYVYRRETIRCVDRVIAVSRYIRDLFIHDGWPSSQVDLVYNPVMQNDLVYAPKENLILAACRLEPYKGIDLLLQSLSTISATDWKLLVCGEGTQRSRLEQLSKELKLNERVEFLGRTSFERTHKLMSEARVFIQPNRGPEPFGLGIAEASSLGVPVIATALPALNEIVQHDINGLVVPLNDEKALANAIEKILTDSALARRLSEGGQRTISERFSANSHLKGTLATYEKALTGRLPTDTLSTFNDLGL